MQNSRGVSFFNCWIVFYVSSNMITELLHEIVIEAPTTTEMAGNAFLGA